MPQKPIPAQQLMRHKAQTEAVIAASHVATSANHAGTAAQLVDMVDTTGGDELYFFRLMLARLIWWAARSPDANAAATAYVTTILSRPAPRPREALIVAAVRDHPVLPEFIQHVTHAPTGRYPTHALMDACTTMLSHVAADADPAARWRIVADLVTDALTHHVDPDRPGDEPNGYATTDPRALPALGVFADVPVADDGREPFPVTVLDTDPTYRDAPDGAVLELTDLGHPGWWQRRRDEWVPVIDPTST